MNSDQYFQTVGQWQEYDESESIAEAAAMRQIEADQAAYEQTKQARQQAARLDDDSTASLNQPEHANENL